MRAIKMNYRHYHILFLAVLLNGCQLKNDEKISNYIQEKAIDQLEIDLSKVDWIEWQSIIIIDPYTNIKSLSNRIGVDLSNIETHAIQDVDFYNLIVFVNDGSSVAICESEILFSPTNELLKRDNLIFRKENDDVFKLVSE